MTPLSFDINCFKAICSHKVSIWRLIIRISDIKTRIKLLIVMSLNPKLWSSPTL